MKASLFTRLLNTPLVPPPAWEVVEVPMVDMSSSPSSRSHAHGRTSSLDSIHDQDASDSIPVPVPPPSYPSALSVVEIPQPRLSVHRPRPQVVQTMEIDLTPSTSGTF